MVNDGGPLSPDALDLNVASDETMGRCISGLLSVRLGAGISWTVSLMASMQNWKMQENNQFHKENFNKKIDKNIFNPFIEP